MFDSTGAVPHHMVGVSISSNDDRDATLARVSNVRRGETVNVSKIQGCDRKCLRVESDDYSGVLVAIIGNEKSNNISTNLMQALSLTTQCFWTRTNSTFDTSRRRRRAAEAVFE